MEWLQWMWLGIFVTALLIEISTVHLVSIWISLAAIPSYVMSLLSIGPGVQIATFLVVTALLLFLTRPVVIKYFKTNEIKTNVDTVIGQNAVCIEKIQANTVGAVQLKTRVWSAISDETIEVNDQVRILDVEGVKLIVKKI